MVSFVSLVSLVQISQQNGSQTANFAAFVSISLVSLVSLAQKTAKFRFCVCLTCLSRCLSLSQWRLLYQKTAKFASFFCDRGFHAGKQPNWPVLRLSHLSHLSHLSQGGSLALEKKTSVCLGGPVPVWAD